MQKAKLEICLTSNLLLTLVQGAPTCHQTWTACRWVHSRWETHRSDMIGQDHRRRQLHQSDVIVKCLWVELQEEQKLEMIHGYGLNCRLTKGGM